MRFRVSVEFELDRSSQVIWTDDEEGVSSVKDFIKLMFYEQDIEIEETEVRRID